VDLRQFQLERQFQLNLYIYMQGTDMMVIVRYFDAQDILQNRLQEYRQ
jgi:hypothetical protein